MNFLAHIYLSGSDEEVIVGNFIGDFVKGKAYEEYSPGIQRGILLHREIDRYTDEHAVVTQSKERLRPKYHHYAPVIVDIFYDHFLAAHWDNYHSVALKTFTTDFYTLIKRFDIPQNARFMLKYMERDDWLYHYQFTHGIHQALSGMARRTAFRSKMEQASADLTANYEAYQKEFVTFFPDLKKHAAAFLASLL